MDKSQAEILAVLNLIPYLDAPIPVGDGITLGELVENTNYTNYAETLDSEEREAWYEIWNTLVEAVTNDETLSSIELVDVSSSSTSEASDLWTNSTDGSSWTDDLIQACTLRDADGNYYVTYRGTGNGRWGDNGVGMTAESTVMQEAAKAYFDEIAETYLVDAYEDGKSVYVSGHSKGGNEAQYVYMTSEYEYLIDGCYSYDGQGFSSSAIESFIERYGEEGYEEKLQSMYSICGENDFVHDLGNVIIPEENTYFVPTSGSDFASYHALTNMITDDDGNYTGLGEGWEDNAYEQGIVGQIAKKISEKMMEMDPDDLDGCAVAIMTIIELWQGSGGDSLGVDDTADVWDYIDLLAHGVPTVVEVLVELAYEYVYEKCGTVGVIAAGFVAVLVVVAAVALAPVLLTIAKAALVIEVIANVVDFIYDNWEKIVQFAKDVNEFVSELKNLLVEAVKKIAYKLKTYSAGYKYASSNPEIKVDTTKLTSYATRLTNVNKRIANLDSRLNTLYWQVELTDLWDLLQADLLTTYSYRLSKCVSYLTETAKDFEAVETSLTKAI